MSAPVFVRVGLCTPLGLSARATQCAMSAGITCFRETPLIAYGGDPVRAARLTALDPASSRLDRMLFFGARALRECLAGVPASSFVSLPVFVALPESDRGAQFTAAGVARALAHAAPPGVSLDGSPPAHPAGRAGFFHALEAARAAITQRVSEAALVVGLDSYCDEASLVQLDEGRRILGDDNPDGLIPGEGAGAVLLADPAWARRAGLPALAALLACAHGRDTDPFERRTGAHARGLTATLRALSRAAPARVDAVFSCQTGEGLWARELSIAHIRNVEIMPEPQKRYLIAETLGDVGAASGAIQTAYFVHLAGRRKAGRRKLERAIVYGAADSGEVGACVVSVR